VEHALRSAGIGLDIAQTTGPGDAAALAAARAAGHDAVFVLGGDGTVTEVLGALAGRGIAVGILPAGTGNLLARAVGIPLAPRRAASVLLRGERRPLDLARLRDGTHFAVAAGIGIDAEMLRGTTPALKRRLGVLAYVISGARAAIADAWLGRTFTAVVTVDGVTHEVEALSVLVANVGRLLDGWITAAPGTSPDDGMADVCVYAPRTLPQALRVAWRMLRGRFPEDGLTRFYRGRTVRLEARPRKAVEADGELLADTVLDLAVLPRAATLLVPPK
jgi:YegS/Rv2252/BmrU family lipid kinase